MVDALPTGGQIGRHKVGRRVKHAEKAIEFQTLGYLQIAIYDLRGALKLLDNRKS